MLVTNLKGRRSCPCFKIQELHGEERPQQWREWGKRAPPGWVCSGWERGGRRGHQLFVLSLSLSEATNRQ